MSPRAVVGSSVRWPLPARTAARVAETVLRGEGARDAAVSLAFVGARRMRSLNQASFGKDRPTDVIAWSFDLPAAVRRRQRAAGVPVMIGVVYVCPDVAARNARRFAVPLREELARLIVHGVLHVLGYDHPEGARERSAMWRRQERYLRRAGA